ncbi:MAG: isoprenylcysteine carboxylmethyltransferase family protein [Xanthobacteraceae bacterium]|nr:isoprenylcysteine carboxylmethyltransferase family protein [Xanthobacteraceae bacterium]
MTIASVQLIRKAVLLLVVLGGVVLFAIGTCTYDHDRSVHMFVKWTGLSAMVVCVLGRTWCALYIGGRKIDDLVTVGPYSVVRNPLYWFSVLGTAGAGAQFGSILSALAFAAISLTVFRVVVAQEEKLLLMRHGQAFADYAALVPRFLPDPRLWKDMPLLTVRPGNVVRTFGDALLLMLFLPVSELFERLQLSGALPVLLRLP